MSTAERHSAEADGRDETDQIPNIPGPETRQEPAKPGSSKATTLDPRLEEKRTKQLDDLVDNIRKLKPDSSEDSQVKTLTALLSDLDAETLDRPTGKSSWTALHVAAKHGLPVAARMLVQKGATVDSRSPSNRTPLQVACQHGKLAVAAVLVDRGADVNACGPQPRSPLMYASKDGFIEIVDLLLKHNTDPLVTMRNKRWTALHYACWYGQKAVAERLLAKDDSNLNDKDNKNGLVPLGMAVMRGHEEVVKAVLRDRDAETNPVVGPGDAPLPAGFQPGPSERRPRTRVQLEATGKLGRTMLVVAAQSGYAGIFEALVKAGANTEVTYGKSGETVLMHICRSGHLDVAEKLFDLRDNILIDAADHEKETPLHKASSGGHVKLVKLLVDKGASVNVRDRQIWTPLHRACEQGHLEVIQMLLQHGADATARNSAAKNALHIACSASAKGTPTKDAGDLDTGSNGDTNMQTMVSSDVFEQIIATLLAKGCNPFLEDQNKKTAFHHSFPEDSEPTTLNFLLNGVKKHYFGSTSRDSAAEVKVLLWAIGKSQRHEIVKVILSQPQPSAEGSPETLPPASQEWNVIEWAAFRGYPWVLFPLLAEAVKSATPKTLHRALRIAEDALRKQSKQEIDGDAASDGGARPDISPIEVNRQTVRDLLLYPPFTSFSTQGIKLQPPTRPKDRQKLLQAWTASIIQFRVPKAGTSSFLRRDRSVWDVIYGEGPRKIITDEQKKLSHLLEQLKASSDAGKALVDKSGHLDHDSRDTTFGWVHLPATNMVWMNHLLQKMMYEDLPSEETTETGLGSITSPTETSSKTPDDKLKEQKETEFQEMSYFLNDSWSQIPDGASRFRIMRPSFVKSSKGNPAPKNPTLKSETSKAGDDQEGKPQPSTKSPGPASPQSKRRNRGGALFPANQGDRGGSRSPDPSPKEETTRIENRAASSQVIQAIYLPYLVFSEYYKEEGRMTSEERSKLAIEHAIPQKSTPDKDGNESDDTELEEDEARSEGHHEEDDSSEHQHQQGTVSETPIRETPRHRWNILRDRAKLHDDMTKAYEDDVVHKCSTLDESYYHFEVDNDEAENDRQYRNGTQIVTKNARKSRRSKKQGSRVDENGIKPPGNRTEMGNGKGENGAEVKVTRVDSDVSRAGIPLPERTSTGLKSLADKAIPDTQRAPNSGSHSVEEISDEDLHWPILRVNQLWVWVIDREWLITSTTDPLDDAEKPFITGFLDHLNKQAAAGRMHSQPQTTFDISRALVDYCIGAYDRIPEGLNPEGGHRRSVRQIFSQSINDIATEETKLYETFRTQKNTDHSAQRHRWLVGSSQEANQQIENNIWRAIGLSHELKDVKDELNILSSVAKYQSVVQRDQRGRVPLPADKSAMHVVDDIDEMEKMADRLQSSIDTTLSLEQNEISIAEARETVKQGRILMVFTLITIVFLPLSFLATFFAIDFSTFLQTPYWVHFIIFFGSFAFSICFAFAAVKWDYLRANLQKLVDRSRKGPSAADRAVSVQGIKVQSEVGGDGIRKPKETGSVRFRIVRRHREKDVEKGT